MKSIILAMLTVLLISAVIFGGCAKPTEPTESTEPVKPIEWRWASFIPPGDIYATEATDWAKRLEEATDGRVKISFYFAESLVKMTGLFDAVAAGTANIAQFSTAPTAARFPLSQIFSLVMIWKSPPQAGESGIALINKYKEFQDEFYPTKVIWLQAPGPTDLTTTDVPVLTMEDLAGLKIRASGRSTTIAYQLLGAAPLYLPSGDVYQALETGVIDGDATDWNALYVWRRHEVTKYRTDNVAMNMNTFPTVINIASYDNLPADIKEIFNELTNPTEMSRRINTAFGDFANESIAKLKEFDEEVGNPPFYVLPETERDRWKEVVWPVNEEWVSEVEEKGLPGSEMLADAIALAEQYK